MLTLSGITKAYGGRTLFSDVTLQLNRGDRLGLVGPNGAGKTTLFSLMLGEESADDGGKGDYTPHFGLLLRKLSHSVISSNTLFHGYMKDMTADLGEHGADYVFANNVGCPMK